MSEGEDTSRGELDKEEDAVSTSTSASICKDPAFLEALEKFAQNRKEDVTVYSKVPDRCKTATCYVGIDEAGRGPVLGPMVYGIFAAVSDENKIKSKKDQGLTLAKIEECPPVLIDSISKLNDSKQLTEKIREEIFAQFADLDHVAYGIKIISPTQISSQSYRRQKISLNEVSHQAAMELIQGFLDRGIQIGRVYVDTVGPMDKYQTRLEQKFPTLKFKVDKKADSKYKPVSAASICAKVTRDEALKNWTFTDDIKVKIPSDGWGSGYPGDAVTKRFLRVNIDPIFGFPNIVRDSWSTASDLLEKRAVKIKWEVEDEGVPLQKISKFFAKTKKPEDGEELENIPVVKRKTQFFSYRDLTQTNTLF